MTMEQFVTKVVKTPRWCVATRSTPRLREKYECIITFKNWDTIKKVYYGHKNPEKHISTTRRLLTK